MHDRNAPCEQEGDKHLHQEWGIVRGWVKEEEGAPDKKERSPRAKRRHLEKVGNGVVDVGAVRGR
jgi:hypothetical protein